MRRHPGFADTLLLAVAGLLLTWPLTSAQEAPPDVGFHHVHMNVVDPDDSLGFYTRSFEQTRRTIVAGFDALQSEDVYVLFNQVPQAASAEWDTALWHFGWNSPDLVADHRRLAAQGAVFFRVPPPSGHMWAPDGNDVEISPFSPHGGGRGPRAFNHVHLMSAAPLCAAEWYARMLGLERVLADDVPPAGECQQSFGPRRDPGNQIHTPNARLRVSEIILFIYPNQQPSRALDSPRGHVLDHIAFTVADVSATVARMRNAGVTVIEPVHYFGNTSRPAAMIEGPDRLAIELVQRVAEPSSGRTEGAR